VILSPQSRLRSIHLAMKLHSIPSLCGALLLPVLALCGATDARLCAQESGPDTKGETAKDGAEKKKEQEPKWFAIVGGDVHTGTGAVLRGATVLSKDGVIEKIGHALELPEGTQTLDAKGLRVYPGLVAISASLAVTQGSRFLAEDDIHMRCCIEFGKQGHAHEGPLDAELDLLLAEQAGVLDPQSDLRDAYDPFSSSLLMTLAVGITSAEQSGGILKLKRGEIDGVVMRERYLSTFSWSSASAGKTALREKFDAAARYLREKRNYEERKDKDKELKEPSKKGVDSKALAVLEGSVRASFNANNRDDLLGIARLAQDYGFRPVIEGCVEGWTVAEELGRAGAFAVIYPRQRRDKDENLVSVGGSSIENAAILHAHGVQVAIGPATTGIDLGGITGRDLLHLTVDADFAVRGGLSDAAALAGITIIPARILGVDHRVGTLEKGKDCDAIVCDGDILHYETLVQQAVVAGKLVYEKDKELLFAHIRPRDLKEGKIPGLESAPAESAASQAGAGESGK
jgi:imidazolonepropionase-like amidohydrolase